MWMGNPENRARKRRRKHSTQSNNSTENVNMDAGAAAGDNEELQCKEIKAREVTLDINTDNYIMFQILKDMFSTI